MNIYEKLSEIHKSVGYIQKGQKGKQYDYVGSSDVLAAVRQQMNEQKLILIPEVKSSNVREYETKTGTLQIFTELVMKMTWLNTEKPEEKLAIDWYAQGMDLAGEKGVGKALTYGEKYFLLKFFNIATDKDDPDTFQEKVEASKPKKLATDDQIKQLEKVLDDYSEVNGAGDADGKRKMRAWAIGQLRVNNFANAEETDMLELIARVMEMVKKAEQQKNDQSQEQSEMLDRFTNQPKE